MFATAASAAPAEQGGDGETNAADNGAYVNISPAGVTIAPGPGKIGYQWGFQIGYLLRSESVFALAVGGGFEHAMMDFGILKSADPALDHQLRAQAELMPGLSLFGDRLFLHLNLGVGYAAWIQRSRSGDDNELEVLTDHGVVFSPGVGASLRLLGNFTLGGSVGGDFQWFDPTGDGSTAHNFGAKFTVGWMF